MVQQAHAAMRVLPKAKLRGMIWVQVRSLCAESRRRATYAEYLAVCLFYPHPQCFAVKGSAVKVSAVKAHICHEPSRTGGV